MPTLCHTSSSRSAGSWSPAGCRRSCPFSVFNFLVHGLYLTADPWLATQPITAFVIANLVGMVVSYRLSRYWTFRHRPPVHADGGRTAFFLINLVTLPLVGRHACGSAGTSST